MIDKIINTVICGDCLEVMRDWPDNCVDLVLTDPPYSREYVYLYGGIAKISQYICKPQAFVYFYGGTAFLPEVLRDISEYLDWFWVFNIKHNTGIPRIWNKKLFLTSKVVLVWTNGKIPQDKTRWCAVDFNLERKAKEYHEWGQDILFPLEHIDMRTQPNAIVIDPCCGSGTTLVAAKMLGRRYIGIDISSEYCQIARQRLEAVDTGVSVQEQKAGQLALFPKNDG